MRSNLFWLSDEQWVRIEPYLPTDVRGKERVDDRRVISGIVHVLKSGCRWKDCPERIALRSTARPRRSTIALRDGQSAAFGKVYSGLLPSVADRPRRR